MNARETGRPAWRPSLLARSGGASWIVTGLFWLAGWEPARILELERSVFFAVSGGLGWLLGNLAVNRRRPLEQPPEGRRRILWEGLLGAGFIPLSGLFVQTGVPESGVWTSALALLVYGTLFFVPVVFERRH